MGLDITAYSHLEYVGVHEFDPELNEGEPGPYCYYDGHVTAHAYDCFPASFKGIPLLDRPEGFYENALFGGCYATTDKTETHRFRAGSYSGYNAWRSDLARQFNPAPIANLREGMQEPDPNLPFYELIWFADNEGCIGPEAAAELLVDFGEHANEYEPATGYFRDLYTDWTRAFELAAQSGLVDFH